ncbi:MAG: phage tail protein [Candidatus Wallbacteria bacterium]|nr:phage tail protein [Candidatus Wallbacteria bacterium]
MLSAADITATLDSSDGSSAFTVKNLDETSIGWLDSTGNATISGGLLLGNSTSISNGTIRWTGADFEGRKGGAWVSFTQSVPPGTILPYGGTTAPNGYLLCNGASFLRTAYSDLFTAIGTAYGAVDGTHFNVPDLRGRFIRGTDNGAGNDPDAGARVVSNAGGHTGDNVGSLQADALESHLHAKGTLAADNGGIHTHGNGTLGTSTTGAHTHVVRAGRNYGKTGDPSDWSDNNSNPETTSSAGDHSHTITGALADSAAHGHTVCGSTANTGGNETRPANIYVNFIIKY